MKTIIALAALVAVTSPAFARPPQSGSWQIGNDSFHIYYADLDMATIAGRAQLLARVERAAGRLCADVTDRRDCIKDTIGQLATADVQQALADRAAIRMAAR